MILLMATSLYTSRVVLSSLGVKDFGIYNVVGGIVTSLGFLNGALSTASSRFITIAIGKGDENNIKRIFSNILTIILILCVIVFLISETVGLWFFNTKMSIPDERMNAAFWVYQISVATVLLNIASVPYNATIIAHERMKAFAYISLFDAFAKLGVAYLISISLGIDKLIFYAILLFVIYFIDRLIYSQYCIRKFSETKFHLSFDKNILKEMGAFIGWSAYGNFVSVGFTQGLNILLNIFFGPAVNAARGIAVQVQSAILAFTINFQTAINPQIMKSFATKDLYNVRKLLIASSKFSFFLLCLLGIPIVGSTDFILSLWLGKVPDYTVAFVRLMIVIAIIQSLANPIRIVNQAEGHIKKFQKYECSFLLLILPISYFALKSGCSPISVFVVQLIVEFFAQFLRIYIVLEKIDMQICDYIKNVYCRVIPIMVISLFITLFINSIVQSGINSIIINIFVTITVLSFSIWWIGLIKTERVFVKNKVSALLKKKNV